MGEKSSAFVKGGCGCLIAFAVLAMLAVAIGGRARIDLGGALCLFVLGGIVGLVLLLIFNQGKAAAKTEIEETNKEISD